MAASESDGLLNEFEVVDEIGSGAFGKVVKIRRRQDGQFFVWKELSYARMSEKEKKLMVSEVNILRQLSHPHIVRYEDRILDRISKKIYIIMEYCAGGDLADLIYQKEQEYGRFEEGFIWRVLSGVASALSDCHKTSHDSEKILHRDLKPGNIFFDDVYSPKLGDFGLSRILSHSSMFAYTHVGTPYYMSPEQVSQEEYDEKSDIWSLGCILYEMCALSPPFDAENQLALALKIKAGKYKPVPKRLGYSEDLLSVIYSMLQVDPDRRPYVEKILQLRQVALELREERISRRYGALKMAEGEVAKMRACFDEKTKGVVQREIELQKQTRRLLERERELVERELRVSQREKRQANGCEYCGAEYTDHDTVGERQDQNFAHQDLQDGISSLDAEYFPDSSPRRSSLSTRDLRSPSVGDASYYSASKNSSISHRTPKKSSISPSVRYFPAYNSHTPSKHTRCSASRRIRSPQHMSNHMALHRLGFLHNGSGGDEEPEWGYEKGDTENESLYGSKFGACFQNDLHSSFLTVIEREDENGDGVDNGSSVTPFGVSRRQSRSCRAKPNELQRINEVFAEQTDLLDKLSLAQGTSDTHLDDIATTPAFSRGTYGTKSEPRHRTTSSRTRKYGHFSATKLDFLSKCNRERSQRFLAKTVPIESDALKFDI